VGQAKVTVMGNDVIIALGGNSPSNVGQPLETIESAFVEIRKAWGQLTSSKLYQTPAFPAGSGPDYVNAACRFHATSSAEEILATLLGIEAQFGRTRTRRWGQRTLDLDLIAVGDQVLPDRSTFNHWQNLPLDDQKTTAPEALVLPHPRLQDRPFVLVPLADIASDWVHPVLGQTVTEMLAAYDDAARAEIRQL